MQITAGRHSDRHARVRVGVEEAEGAREPGQLGLLHRERRQVDVCLGQELVQEVHVDFVQVIANSS